VYRVAVIVASDCVTVPFSFRTHHNTLSCRPNEEHDSTLGKFCCLYYPLPSSSIDGRLHCNVFSAGVDPGTAARACLAAAEHARPLASTLVPQLEHAEFCAPSFLSSM
jgi:hypothetical protein